MWAVDRDPWAVDKEQTTSHLNIEVKETSASVACTLNEIWHSRLPQLNPSNVWRNKHYICFLFLLDEAVVGTGIWSSPVARMLSNKTLLELRRLALSKHCPKNTATFVLSKMAKAIKQKFPDITTLISYQDTEVHLGTIYKAANWKQSNISTGGEWTRKSRGREKVQTTSPKVRWEYQI